MGHFSYTVSPIAGLPTGTQIRNVADVSFDEQPIIATDQVSETDPTQGTDPAKEALVTIDAGPPTSTVAALPPQETAPSFTVSWSGSDDAGGSGIATFDVFVSTDGGPFVPFETETTATSATFNGAVGHTYGFYSVATDNVGNREATPTSAQASTNVVTPPQLIVSSNADSGPGSLRQALLDANNSSGMPHTIDFQLLAGSQTITLLSPLPTATDPLTLSLDATQNVTLIPSAGAVWTVNQSLSIVGAGSISMGSGIEGTGDLSVGGGSLTTTHIIQDALVIGGTAGSPAVVTIAPSDSAGNPLGVGSANRPAVLALSMAAVAAPSISDGTSTVSSAAANKQQSAQSMQPSTSAIEPSNLDAALGLDRDESMFAPQPPISTAMPTTSTFNPIAAEPAVVTRPIDSGALAAVMSQYDPFEWRADSGVARRAAADLPQVLCDDLFADLVGD